METLKNAVKPLDDVVRYYHYAFIPIYALVLSSFILTLLSIKKQIIFKNFVVCNNIVYDIFCFPTYIYECIS